MDSKQLMEGLTLKVKSLNDSTHLLKKSVCLKCGTDIKSVFERRNLTESELRFKQHSYPGKTIETYHDILVIPGDERYLLCELDAEKCFAHEYEALRKHNQGVTRSSMRLIFPPKFLIEEYPFPSALAYYVPTTSDEFQRGLCLTGKSGVGKTTSMTLIAREWFRSMEQRANSGMKALHDPRYDGYYASAPKGQMSWKFISYPDFVMDLQSRFKRDKGEESAYEFLAETAAVPFLIIDDLGAQKMTEYVKQATYYLINEREMHMRQTFITTNFALGEIGEMIDSRIASRISGMCDVKEISGLDMRGRKKA